MLSAESNSILEACDRATNLIKIGRELLPSRYPQSISGTLDYASTYIALKRATYSCNSSSSNSNSNSSSSSDKKVLRLTLRLVEQAAALESSASSGSLASYDYMQAKLLLAQTFHECGDTQQAVTLLLEIEKNTNSSSCFSQYTLEAAALQAVFNLQQFSSSASSSDRGQALVVLKESILTARQSSFPTVVALACEALADV
jgi:thioredoxin-like negative regulator of GroEL